MPPIVKTPVPEDWYTELRAAADAQGLSIAALLRLIIRGFLRGRYTPAEREVLER